MLEFAVLGLLHESPLHGYELRRRLNSRLGTFRALSFGTLYPCLAGLQSRGLISGARDEPGTSGRRQRITYALTGAGRETFARLAHRSDPTSWEDDVFDVRLAFFTRTEQEVRTRILEGRRARLAERLAAMRLESVAEPRPDRWTAALRAHGEDSTERALQWIEELLEIERREPRVRPGTLSDPSHPAFNPPPQTPTKENR